MILRHIVLLFHALGTKSRLVKESFKQILHGWVSRIIVAVNIKTEMKEFLNNMLNNRNKMPREENKRELL